MCFLLLRFQHVNRDATSAQFRIIYKYKNLSVLLQLYDNQLTVPYLLFSVHNIVINKRFWKKKRYKYAWYYNSIVNII